MQARLASTQRAILYETNVVLAKSVNLLIFFNKDQLEVFLPYRDTLILRALEKLFGDNSVLVKREVLDFLIFHLPLNSHILTCRQKVKRIIYICIAQLSSS